MKVLMFHDFADVRGGANRYRMELTRMLRERGVEVSLFTFNQGDSSEEGKVTIFPFHGNGALTGRMKQHLFNPKLFRMLRKVIDKERPDLIHVQGNCLYSHTVYLACSKGPPLVQTAHDIRIVCPNERGVRKNGLVCPWSFGTVCVSEGCIPISKYIAQVPSRKLVRRLFSREDWTLITPSRALAENVTHFGIEPVLVPNFVHTHYFEGGILPGASRSILFVGSLYPSKGVDHLLRSFREVLDGVPSAILDIVGVGPEMNDLQRSASELGVGGAVKFHGQLDEERLRPLFGASRVVVLPSVVKENCPLVILEAMAAGRPVVASRLGGIPELVQEETTGLLVPYGDSPALARALVRILEDGAGADRMGKNGREVVRRTFTSEIHMQQLGEVYTKTAGLRIDESISRLV